MPDPATILTLDDLPAWSFRGTALAVLGHPVAHSISPAMHNAALAEMARADGTFANWQYFRFDVPPERLAGALTELHAAGFHGLNLTVPHKVLAFGLVRDISPAAVPLGAVNTLHRTQDGWRGHNTDGHGLSAALQADLEVNLTGAAVILLGAGGAARAAAVECLQRKCASLWIANRTRAHLDALLAALRPLAGSTHLGSFDLAAGLPSEALAKEGAVLINATSSGLKPGEPPPIALRALPAGLRVCDMIYNPPETPLLREAAALGLPRANGLSMLVHQGARSLEIWSGRPAPVPVMHAAARSALPPA